MIYFPTAVLLKSDFKVTVIHIFCIMSSIHTRSSTLAGSAAAGLDSVVVSAVAASVSIALQYKVIHVKTLNYLLIHRVENNTSKFVKVFATIHSLFPYLL